MQQQFLLPNSSPVPPHEFFCYGTHPHDKNDWIYYGCPPLESFCQNNIFKLFVFDIGLLRSMLDLPENRLLLLDYGIARGYFAENFVAQELWASGRTKLHAWQSRNSEIEFILQMNDHILPVEVKSGKRTQAKSLQQYIMRYSPEIAIKISGNHLKI